MLSKKEYEFLQEALKSKFINKSDIIKKISEKFNYSLSASKSLVNGLRIGNKVQKKNEDKVKFILTLLDYENGNRDTGL